MSQTMAAAHGPTIDDFELLAGCLTVGTKYDPRTDPDFQERRDELEPDPLDSQRGNW